MPIIRLWDHWEIKQDVINRAMQRLLSADHIDSADGFPPDDDQLVPAAQGIVNVAQKLFS